MIKKFVFCIFGFWNNLKKTDFTEKNLLNKVLSYISIYYRNLMQFKIYPLTSTTYVKTDLLGEDGKTMWVIYTTNISK